MSVGTRAGGGAGFDRRNNVMVEVWRSESKRALYSYGCQATTIYEDRTLIAIVYTGMITPDAQ